MASRGESPAASPDILTNRKARRDYHILETWEAGLVLTGTEVKALREGKANIGDAYGIVKDGEVWLLNLHISPYERGGYADISKTCLGAPCLNVPRSVISTDMSRMRSAPTGSRYSSSRPSRVHRS